VLEIFERVHPFLEHVECFGAGVGALGVDHHLEVLVEFEYGFQVEELLLVDGVHVRHLLLVVPLRVLLGLLLDQLDLLLEFPLLHVELIDLADHVFVSQVGGHRLHGFSFDRFASGCEVAGLHAVLEVLEGGVHGADERDFAAVLELRLQHASQFAVALGDVGVPRGFAQDDAAEGTETAVDEDGLVEAGVVGRVVLVAELLAAGQVHERDAALDGLLVGLELLHHVREVVFSQLDVERED